MTEEALMTMTEKFVESCEKRVKEQRKIFLAVINFIQSTHKKYNTTMFNLKFKSDDDEEEFIINPKDEDS